MTIHMTYKLYLIWVSSLSQGCFNNTCAKLQIRVFFMLESAPVYKFIPTIPLKCSLDTMFETMKARLSPAKIECHLNLTRIWIKMLNQVAILP